MRTGAYIRTGHLEPSPQPPHPYHGLNPSAYANPAAMLLLASRQCISTFLLLLRAAERGTDKRRRATQLDPDNPLDLGEQLLIRHCSTALEVGNLRVSGSYHEHR